MVSLFHSIIQVTSYDGITFSLSRFWLSGMVVCLRFLLHMPGNVPLAIHSLRRLSYDNAVHDDVSSKCLSTAHPIKNAMKRWLCSHTNAHIQKARWLCLAMDLV